jgi:hypothetical protein
MFAYFTVAMYLVVGTVAVRVLAPEMTTVTFTTSYSKIFSNSEVITAEVEPVVAPEMSFGENKHPGEKKIVRVAKAVERKPAVIVEKVVVTKAPEMKVEKVAKNELPFHEPVTLSKITIQNDLDTNLVALYQDFKYEVEALAAAAPIEDAVSTKLAATEEPEFFEYPVTAETEKKTAPVKTDVKEEIVKEEIADMVSEEAPEASAPMAASAVTEEVAVDDLIAFDYSKADKDIKAQTMPTVSTVTTQGVSVPQSVGPSVDLRGVPQASSSHKTHKPVTTQPEKNNLINKTVEKQMAPVTYPTRMTIQITGTDLEKTVDEVGFEVRFQDDLTEAIQDYGTGEVNLDQTLSNEKMTRSVTVLKRGFAPTNTDLILEAEGAKVSLPLLEEGRFNELLAPFESRGPIGAVLVELEDNVEGAALDVPYSQVLNLDEDLKVTDSNVFSYQLFVGVKAGNALLQYKDGRGTASKIIHVHERELTFESNFFEEVLNERVVLLEEYLLAKEKTPLILSAEEVKEFATNKVAKKINNHTYETDFNRTLLGGRKYLELSHQHEPVFVGFKENMQLEVPSENFMRHILSKFEGSSLGNRCLVQLNLTKKASKVDVAAESVGASLMTYTQILDADGKFYDSVSSKSRKVIVVGENQGPQDNSQDAKINFKVTYEDGSVQFLGSYCSPNTYLVEQL